MTVSPGSIPTAWGLILNTSLESVVGTLKLTPRASTTDTMKLPGSEPGAKDIVSPSS
jgi:hypothetical protein